MFVGEAGAYSNEASFIGSTLGQGASLTHKNYIMVEKPAGDQHFGLLQTFEHYCHKKLTTLASVQMFTGNKVTLVTYNKGKHLKGAPLGQVPGDNTSPKRIAGYKALAYFASLLVKKKVL